MTDYISREAAVKAAQGGADEWDGCFNRNRDTYIECAIDKVPTADVKPVVRGEWIKCGRDRRPLCSKCGYEPLEITREYIVDGKPHSWDSAYNLSNFCPNCGADMRKEVKQNE